MNTKETYTPGYSEIAIRYMKRRHAARDAAFFLPRLKPGMTVLDCGCGPATITVGLAEAVAPGSVIGVDVEAGQVELARQRVQERGLANLRIDQASVYELPFADRSFDAVFSHALFEHLADPLAALREIRRVLRPGGLVGIASPDWDGVVFAPPDRDVEQAIKVYTHLQSRNGGNPFVGRELGWLLQEAGFSGITLTATYDCYERMDLICDLLAERIESFPQGRRPDEAGVPDAETIARLSGALTRWAANPVSLFAQCFVTAVGRAEK